MTHLKVGDKAPELNIPTTDGNHCRIADYTGQYLVLYFYPKDDTPGCTKEACAFRDNLAALNQLNTAVLGVSKDALAKHQKFLEKHDLNFPLASDADSDVCERYGVWTEKSMYGKKYWGIERTTFLIDPKGVITAIWPKVKVDRHIDQITDALSDMQKAA